MILVTGDWNGASPDVLLSRGIEELAVAAARRFRADVFRHPAALRNYTEGFFLGRMTDGQLIWLRN